MQYVMFLFIFNGNPDTGAGLHLVQSQSFGSQAACEAAGEAVTALVTEYAQKAIDGASDVAAELSAESPEMAELVSLYQVGQQARTLCVARE